MKQIIESNGLNEVSIIQDFLSHLEDKKHFSPYTARSYGTDLTQFAAFLLISSRSGLSAESNLHHEESNQWSAQSGGTATATETTTDTRFEQLILAVDTEMVRKYLAALKQEQYSTATIARKLATLRSFYKFLVKRNYRASNPVISITSPKQERKLPRILEYEEVQRLLNAPSANTLLGARDRAILESLYSTGMRVSELVALNTDDIDYLDEVIHIKTKGKKERVSPIGSSALQAIQHYLELRNKRMQNDSDFDVKVLFANKRGQRLSTRSVRRKMDKYLKIAGLDTSISPHTLRHSFAAHMLDKGVDLKEVQQLLGHQSLSTTQVYRHLGTSKIKDMYDSSHLRDTSEDSG